jgi:1,4-dihydroxy-2-naphthoyl-CoA hydrolase
MDPLEKLNQETLPFAQLLGIRLLSAAPDRVVAEMLVRDDLCTRPAVLHGGAMMAFADTLGACATAITCVTARAPPRLNRRPTFSPRSPSALR